MKKNINLCVFDGITAINTWFRPQIGSTRFPQNNRAIPSCSSTQPTLFSPALRIAQVYINKHKCNPSKPTFQSSGNLTRMGECQAAVGFIALSRSCTITRPGEFGTKHNAFQLSQLQLLSTLQIRLSFSRLGNQRKAKLLEQTRSSPHNSCDANATIVRNRRLVLCCALANVSPVCAQHQHYGTASQLTHRVLHLDTGQNCL